LNWNELLAAAPIDSVDLKPILKHKPATAYLFLCC
jgi:hypothetical protein